MPGPFPFPLPERQSMYLFPCHALPLAWQAPVTFAVSWIVMLLGLARLRPSKHRENLSLAAFMAFSLYWLHVSFGFDLGRFSPLFGPDGMGDLAVFALVLLLVLRSIEAVETHSLRRLTYVGRLDITYSESGPRLTRRPPLIETSGLAEPKPPVDWV